MRKFLLILAFSFQVLTSFAQTEELILKNEVEITNKALMDIIKKEVWPRFIDYDDGVLISMKYDETYKTDIIHIFIMSLLYISKEEWKSYDGFCIVEDVVFLFNNCKHCNIISKKENPMPLKVYPDDAKICQNGCQWFYEYRNGKLKQLKRL